jgi:hypothetical protein
MIKKSHRRHTGLFCIFASIVLAWLIYTNYTGRYAFGGGAGQQWNSSGPGYHK